MAQSIHQRHVTLTDTAGNEVAVPARFQVCQACDGEGRVLNPSIASHAYSLDDFREAFDEEAAEEYLRGGAGRYGVECSACRGLRVVLVPDIAACDASARATVAADAASRREGMAEINAERRLAGMMGGEW